jgi:hypothetical protein
MPEPENAVDFFNNYGTQPKTDVPKNNEPVSTVDFFNNYGKKPLTKQDVNLAMQDAPVYLDNNELSKLDSFEKIYTKKEVKCQIMINEIYNECKCLTYIANDNTWLSPPSEQYLIAIKIMLDENFRNNNYIIISKINENNKIENIQKWTIKNINELSLVSLFVIVNKYKDTE